MSRIRKCIYSHYERGVYYFNVVGSVVDDLIGLSHIECNSGVVILFMELLVENKINLNLASLFSRFKDKYYFMVRERMPENGYLLKLDRDSYIVVDKLNKRVKTYGSFYDVPDKLDGVKIYKRPVRLIEWVNKIDV